MAKNATIGIRVDERLKEESTAALDRLGITMPQAIEMLLNYVVDNGKLPFRTGVQQADDTEKCDRIWKSYIEWNFDLEQRFDTIDAQEYAENEFDWESEKPLSVVSAYLKSMPPSRERSDASYDMYRTNRLLAEANMFMRACMEAPACSTLDLAARNADRADRWRIGYLRKQEVDCLPRENWELNDEELFKYLPEWLAYEATGPKASFYTALEINHIRKNATPDDFEDFLESEHLYDDFVEYVNDALEDMRDEALESGTKKDDEVFGVE